MAKIKKKVVREKPAPKSRWFEVIDGRLEIGIEDLKTGKTRTVYTKGDVFESDKPFDTVFKNKVRVVDSAFAERLVRKARLEAEGLEEVDEEEEILDEDVAVEPLPDDDEDDTHDDAEDDDAVADDADDAPKKKKKKKKVK